MSNIANVLSVEIYPLLTAATEAQQTTLTFIVDNLHSTVCQQCWHCRL